MTSAMLTCSCVKQILTWPVSRIKWSGLIAMTSNDFRAMCGHQSDYQWLMIFSLQPFDTVQHFGIGNLPCEIGTTKFKHIWTYLLVWGQKEKNPRPGHKQQLSAAYCAGMSMNHVYHQHMSMIGGLTHQQEMRCLPFKQLVVYRYIPLWQPVTYYHYYYLKYYLPKKMVD